jgi:N6-L-threonylcarbamoyladenine synthase
MGKTRDDAVGEAFDKVARSIGLGYPGGPKIDKISKEGNENAIEFPRSYLENGSYDFSFSGVKSAVLNYINQCKMKEKEINVPDIAASFQKSVVEVIVSKTIKAAKELQLDKIALAGGVAANSKLREEMEKACEKEGIILHYPSPVYCTDNAAMIGVAAYYEYINGVRHKMDLNAIPNLKLNDRL